MLIILPALGAVKMSLKNTPVTAAAGGVYEPNLIDVSPAVRGRLASRR